MTRASQLHSTPYGPVDLPRATEVKIDEKIFVSALSSVYPPRRNSHQQGANHDSTKDVMGVLAKLGKQGLQGTSNGEMGAIGTRGTSETKEKSLGTTDMPRLERFKETHGNESMDPNGHS